MHDEDPHGSLDELLRHSGQAELFVRQFIQPQEETNHSILPRYFAINPEDVRSAKLLGESVGDGYRGLALTAKGVAIRASNAKLADARALVLQTAWGSPTSTGLWSANMCSFVRGTLGPSLTKASSKPRSLL